MFEVEFLSFDGGWVVIDFNPRLYNQIGLDIAQGLPLPALFCLGALDEKAELREAVAKALAVNDNQTMVLHDRFTLRAMLVAMYVTSRISRDDFAYWGPGRSEMPPGLSMWSPRRETRRRLSSTRFRRLFEA
jgi:hypothetical protein